jgi:hypothetical protein
MTEKRVHIYQGKPVGEFVSDMEEFLLNPSVTGETRAIVQRELDRAKRQPIFARLFPEENEEGTLFLVWNTDITTTEGDVNTGDTPLES